jgi:acyl carrier protein
MKEKLIIALADALEMEINEINPKDSFREYKNYSSLSELSVLAMLDSEFSIEIEMQEYNKLKTIDDLINLVIKRSSK